MTVAGRMRTGDIEENTATRTFLGHTSLRGRGWQRLLQRAEVLINRLPGNHGAQVTRRWPHGVAGRINPGGIEHITERLHHRHIHVRPRDPGLDLRIKKAYMQSTIEERHTSFHAASIPHNRVK